MADVGSGDGSPSHPKSDLSTNPNTPRTESPEPAPTHPIYTTRPEASPGSSTSGGSRYDIQPTWPKMIDLTKASAVATWGDERLSDLFLDLHWHTPSNKAFFKLRATIFLSMVPGRRDGKTSIYVFIHPERIRQLSVELVPIETGLGSEAVSLKFLLERPPVLVVPNTPYEPKSAAAKQLLERFHAFASQSCFDIHAEIPRRKLSSARLQELCAVVSERGVASLAAHANAARLYQGRGGQIIEGSTLIEICAPPEPDEPPPEYDEPPAASSSKIYQGQKRRRRSSTDAGTDKAPESSTRAAMQSLLDANLSLLRKYVDDALALQRQEIAKDVADQVGQAEARILTTLRGEIEGRCEGMQERLEDVVHEQLAEVEDNIMRNLTEAPLQATLTFPQHPWY